MKGGLCFFHANPNKASELGRIGGRKKKRSFEPASVDPLPRMNDSNSVGKTIQRVIDETYSGKIDPRMTASITQLLGLQLRAIEMADLQDRVEALESGAGSKGENAAKIPEDSLNEVPVDIVAATYPEVGAKRRIW